MPVIPATGPVRLATNLAEYTNTKAIYSGDVRSDLVKLELCGPKLAYQGFKPMIREARYDAGELAICSFLQAREAGKPLVLVPVPCLSRFQHANISYNCTRGDYGPKGLEGKRCAVRAYSTTTGVWIRGILADEYGVDLSKVTWTSYEDPHPAEAKDPPFVVRFDLAHRTLESMLIAGDVDAAIIGGEIPGEPKVKTLIPNLHEAAKAWYAKRGIVPVNHMFVVSRTLSERRPDVVREVYRMLADAKRANPLTFEGIDLVPLGVEALRKTLETAAGYAYAQGVIKHRVKIDDLFDDTTRNLGK
jgi:4,5-dihydroxyphthalate decarboxylase